MARQNSATRPEDLLPAVGEAYRFGEHVWTASRNPDQDGMPRWEVYRDNEFAPVGFISGHLCPLNNGAPGLVPYDLAGRLLTTPKPGRDDECLSNFNSVLCAFELDGARCRTHYAD